MTTQPQVKRTGLEALFLNRSDERHPLVVAIVAALRQELEEMRQANDAPEGIQDTTLRRGEIRFAKRILARLEVGPESRQSAPMWPESAFSADEYVGPLTGE